MREREKIIPETRKWGFGICFHVFGNLNTLGGILVTCNISREFHETRLKVHFVISKLINLKCRRCVQMTSLSDSLGSKFATSDGKAFIVQSQFSSKIRTKSHPRSFRPATGFTSTRSHISASFYENISRGKIHSNVGASSRIC